MATIVRVSRRYRAPAASVFGAWLDPAIAGRWLFATATRPISHVDIDARAGGAFRFIDRRAGVQFEHRGEYVTLAPWRRLTFVLRSPAPDCCPVDGLVSVDIVPQGNGCRLALSHENVPGDRVRDQRARWVGILYGLGVTLDAMQRTTPQPARDVPRAVTGELACITC
jgi:uncharacterized protein YndB with AHSA1/START domain